MSSNIDDKITLGLKHSSEKSMSIKSRVETSQLSDQEVARASIVVHALHFQEHSVWTSIQQCVEFRKVKNSSL